MKRRVVYLAWALSGSIIVGCGGGGGIEVGAPQAPDTSTPPEFRKAMEKAGNKMMKKQMPKDFGTPKTGS